MSSMREYMLAGTPIIIPGLARPWPAMGSPVTPGQDSLRAHGWMSPAYLCAAGHGRSVPVEIGDHYMAEGWHTRVMEFQSYIGALVVREHQLLENEEHADDSQHAENHVAYLAQYPLFDHLPALRRDIIIPDYCAIELETESHARKRPRRAAAADSDSDDHENESDEPLIQAWIGPAGTVTVCHFDAPHNILVQVVGYKRVILFPPGVADEGLYPHPGIMSNTSQVDVAAPDAAAFPKFATHAQPHARVAELGPGDALYIPPRWWHYVTSLTTSISVSFWWGPRG